MAYGRNQWGLNEREEQFAQQVAKGIPVPQAALNCGYTGNSANHYRRAARPRVAQRIAILKEENKRTYELNKTNEQKAIDTEFEDLGVTMKWLVTEAREIMREAKSDGKYKDALESLRLMAELSGHLAKNSKAPVDPNQTPRLPDANSKPAINLSILNQVLGNAERGPGASPSPQRLVTIELEPEASDRDAEPGSGLERTLEALAGPSGSASDGLPDAVAGDGTREPVRVR